MTGVRVRGELIRKYILENVERHPQDIVRATAEQFGITRQAVNKHLNNLVHERAVLPEGKTRRRVYRLAPLVKWHKIYGLKGLAEDIVWRDDVRPLLGEMPSNVLRIWAYGFTEMLNNAIDHSGGDAVTVWVEKTAARTTISINDNGVGIFRKIQAALGLLDERHAVLELAKGKLTTDPANHTGEGIFFASRLFDEFTILSGGAYFGHNFGDDQGWILERKKPDSGTYVVMVLHNHTARTPKSVFDQYTSEDTLGFTKTVVPVRLAQYGDDELVSRSQAKRLLARVDRFRTVVFDFADVASVGQAFADEIFRVFALQHPEIQLIDMNTTPEVAHMISRARSLSASPGR